MGESRSCKDLELLQPLKLAPSCQDKPLHLAAALFFKDVILLKGSGKGLALNVM